MTSLLSELVDTKCKFTKTSAGACYWCVAQSFGYTKCQFINTLLAAAPFLDAVVLVVEVSWFQNWKPVGHCHLKGQAGHSFFDSAISMYLCTNIGQNWNRHDHLLVIRPLYTWELFLFFSPFCDMKSKVDVWTWMEIEGAEMDVPLAIRCILQALVRTLRIRCSLPEKALRGPGQLIKTCWKIVTEKTEIWTETQLNFF